MKDIYQLKLHGTLYMPVRHSIEYAVTRVPGGWLYFVLGSSSSATFVPFDNEFQEVKKQNN